MHDVADYADYIEERQEAVPDEPEESPWSGMELPAIFRHLISRGEAPEVAAMIVDGVMVDRMDGNGKQA